MEKNKHYKEIVAWAKGKTIEYYSNYSEKWKIITSPSWNKNIKYRIKPEPKYVPFTFDDADKLIGKAVTSNNGIIHIITEINKVNMFIGSNVYVSYDTLFKHYTFLDGTPCGKLKK